MYFVKQTNSKLMDFAEHKVGFKVLASDYRL